MSTSSSQRAGSLRGWVESAGLSELDPQDLDLALTHRSYAFESNLQQDNERLEFLGDAIISAVASEYLFEQDPAADEGLLSKRRARLVSRTVLGRLGVEMGLGEFLLLGRGERETGGAHRRSTIGSALEAVVGIVYLRLGYPVAREFVRLHILGPLCEQGDHEQKDWDYKTILQEWTQSHFRQVPKYPRLREEGPPHERTFFVQVEINGKILAEGSGRRVKTAQNEAARKVLDLIEHQPDLFGDAS